jgi:hypothetical protein
MGGEIMKRSTQRFLILIIGLVILIMIPGCFPVIVDDEPWAPDGHWGRYEYYYYPNPGVYQDRDRNLYFYHDGGHWRESPSPPPSFHPDTSHHRPLRLDTDKPYMYHSDVQKRFPPAHQ